jgi:Protein of unknown function (DUF4239)
MLTHSYNVGGQWMSGLLTLWLFVLTVIAAAVLISIGSIWLAKRTVPDPAADQYSSTLAPFLTTVALVYGSLLGFTVVVAWEQFSSAAANVTAESSTLATMYGQTAGVPEPDRTTLRELLRTYTTAVQDEWNRQGVDARGEAERAVITRMYRVLGSQRSTPEANPVTGEFLGQVTVLASQRSTRVLDTKPQIPGLLWAGLLFGGIVLVGMLGFTRLESARGHRILSSTVAVLLGLLLAVVFWLDHPFGRQLGVTESPFEQVLEVFDTVDRMD